MISFYYYYYPNRISKEHTILFLIKIQQTIGKLKAHGLGHFKEASNLFSDPPEQFKLFCCSQQKKSQLQLHI